MERRLRAPASAVWLHVMGRTDRRRDGAKTVALLAETCGRSPVDLHAFCILSGHFHLLIRSALGAAHAVALAVAAPPCSAIRIVGVGFGRHLMEVSRYIHLNPVEAGLTDRADDWPFSSLRFYLGEPSAPGWLVTDAVLGRFGTIGARHRYRAYIEAGLDTRTRDGNGRPRWGALAAGSDAENGAWRIEPMLVPRRGSFRESSGSFQSLGAARSNADHPG